MYKHSEETKNKIRLAHLKKKLSYEHKLKIGEGVKKAKPKQLYFCEICNNEVTWNRKYCKSCSMKIRFKNPVEIEKVVHRKENHYNWQGGKSFEEYGQEFDSSLKEQVRFRDNYKCQLCNCSQLENNKTLDVHHVDYNKQNNELKNLISLCKNCHMKTNFNRDYYFNLFNHLEVLNVRQ